MKRKHLVMVEGDHKVLWFDPLVSVEENGDSLTITTTRGKYLSFKKQGREFKIIEVGEK